MTISATERKEEFMKEFRALLSKYDAEICIEEDKPAYRNYMELYIPSVSDRESGYLLYDTVVANLGRYIDGAE